MASGYASERLWRYGSEVTAASTSIEEEP